MTWQHWTKGLVGAVVGGVTTALSMTVVDPTKFNFQEGLASLGKVAAVAGIMGGVAYLKQSPVPEDEVLTTPSGKSVGLGAWLLAGLVLLGSANVQAQDVTNTTTVTNATVTISNLPPLLTELGQIFADEQAYFGTNTTLTLDAGGLYVNNKFGGLLSIHAPLPLGTNGQVALGIGFAYLDHQFYSANLSLKAGKTVTVPVLGAVYLWGETGPTLNMHDHSVGSQTFAGATKGFDVGKGFWIYASAGVGNISFEPGAAYLLTLSATFKLN